MKLQVETKGKQWRTLFEFDDFEDDDEEVRDIVTRLTELGTPGHRLSFRMIEGRRQVVTWIWTVARGWTCCL